MARRPVFVPDPGGPLVRELAVEFEWHPGFALTQKRQNIEALHRAASEKLGSGALLEISTRSPCALGVRLSAFNLHVHLKSLNRLVPLEAAFQGSKVFADSGQHPEIYESSTGAEARRSVRTYEDEPLAGFEFEGRLWPLEPRTAFYDWLYVRAMVQLKAQRRTLRGELSRFVAFTDIEFNPLRSLNCQARSCALFVALDGKGLAETLAAQPAAFVDALVERHYPEASTS